MITLCASLMLALNGMADCNSNGVDDLIDIADMTSLDCNGDMIPDECQTELDCDGNGLLDSCEQAASMGLVGQFWTSETGGGQYNDRFLVRIDQGINFDFVANPPQAGIQSDFSVRWTGTLTPPVTGEYTFFTRSDDGVRLFVDEQQLISSWRSQPATDLSGVVNLQAGVPVRIRLDYFQAGGDAVVKLEWQPPGMARELLPASVTHPFIDLDGDGWHDDCADCNLNGVPDFQDLIDGTSTDCNGNGNPDECDVLGAEPLGWWRFEQDGGPVLDSGMNALHGDATDAASSIDVPVDPVPQTVSPNLRSIILGGNGYVTIPDPGGVLQVGDSSFTVEAWVRIDDLSDTIGNSQRQVLVERKAIGTPNSEMDYSFLVQSGNVGGTVDRLFGKSSAFTGRELTVLFGNGIITWGIVSNLQINDNEWRHVSFAYDALRYEARFGLDGQYETIKISDPGHVYVDGPLLIGGHTNSSGSYGQFLRGDLDELRIVRGALPEDLLLTARSTADCNFNSVPDACDIADGFSSDCNQNGVPDECDIDCNGNGLPDGCEIADGLSPDCNGDFIPDECQLVDNDCDGDGVPDECQLADEDCNGNGVVDACDIAAGFSLDCNGDLIPDECQLGGEIVIAYDDGIGEYGVRSNGVYMTWLNRFDADESGSIVTAIDVNFNALTVGRMLTAHVWSDPNGDGEPTDAQALWTGLIEVEVANGIQRVDVPDIDLGDGASFFLGFGLPVSSSDFPAMLDISGEPAYGRSWIVGADTPIDPNNLTANAIEYGLVENEDILFGGNWVIRAVMTSRFGDCNGNGFPDDCDIAAGFATDIDGNGIPDECEDCNGNGTLDSLDISSGLSADCNMDGVPDECQLVGNDCNMDGVPDDCQLPGNDCNNNGVLDECDILYGYSEDLGNAAFPADGIPDECQDCNGNGLLDSFWDVGTEISQDCNDDIIPDECQFGDPVNPTVEYIWDDGFRETNVGVIGTADIAWLNAAVVQPGGEWIHAIDVVWGNTVPGVIGQVILWTDPNGDGEPSDAQVLIEFNTRSTNVNASFPTRVVIPPTYIGPEGTPFFVGARLNERFGGAPAPLDLSNADTDSWFAFAAGVPLNLNDLSAFALLFFADADFMVRAVGFDGVMTNDCNANAALDDCDILDGIGTDANGNGVLDECECLGDADGDGDVNFNDLTILLDEWGPCDQPCRADFDGDGSVNFTDLNGLLDRWGETCP